MTKVKEEKVEKVEEQKVKSKCLLSKINAIRKAWWELTVEMEGKGKAGGGAKYDYYKPQQIIDFCLSQELKHDLFSEFKVMGDMCFYNVIDISTGQERTVECPFDIPRKMAASEAQQVGAALTYHSRRLAMMMYKIEDNSKESLKVLEDADFSAKNIPAPIIPAPPINVPSSEVVAPTVVGHNIQPEAPSELVSDDNIDEAEIQVAPPKIAKEKVTAPPAKEIKEKPVATPPPISSPPVVEYVDPSTIMSKKDDIVTPTVPTVKANSIESLYD